MNKHASNTKTKNIIKRLLLISLSLVLLTFAVIPIFNLTINFGTYFLLTFSIIIFIYSCLYNILNDNFKKVVDILIIIFVIALVLIFILLAKPFYLAKTNLQNPPKTAVVLGCKINGDKPSPMLSRRLDKAIELSHASPDTIFIVSGEQSKGQDYSQAYVMKKYMVENGVSPSQIILEEDACNTDENIKFSAQIISELNLPADEVAIVTDSYHQTRAKIYALKNELNTTALSSHTPIYLLPVHIFRECAGIIKALVF
ncbi:MAG: YdcF family protein [Oscillospiraceae bacterium]|nr:YdcF family protein [Oscillospiraceae bacterium]